MEKVKISILKSSPEYNEYETIFVPIHQSDWMEVNVDDLPKIRQGLSLLSDKSPLDGHRYTLFIKPINEAIIIQEAIKLYEADAAKKVQEKKDREQSDARRIEATRITKAINGLKRMIQQIESVPSTDEKLRAASISSLQAQIDELKNQRK